nr:putative ribonuclease H-like domain-containing protein [Tanacetum cinerariifolium]
MQGNSQINIDDKGYWDIGCSRHMTGNISYLSDYEPFDRVYVSFGQGGCKITGKGTIKPASADECMLWHRRLGHLNFKTMNRLVRHNLVRGLPSKCFANDHSCVACLKGKQHKASCKTKLVNSTFFLKTKDETSGILRNFITEIENLKDLKAEAVNTACYVENRVLVNKSQNKTLYELFNGTNSTNFSGTKEASGQDVKKDVSSLRYIALLNWFHEAHLESTTRKFEAKGDEGYFVGYSMYSKAFRVFNKRTRRVEENLHIEFLENKVIEKGAGPNWLFDIDSLTKSMNYVPVVAGRNSFSGTKDAASQEVKKDVSSLRYIALLNWVHDALLESFLSKPQDGCSPKVPEGSGNTNPTASTSNPTAKQMETLTVETPIPTVTSPVPTACLNDSSKPSSDARLISKRVANQEETPSLDNILSLTNRFEDILGVTTSSNEAIRVEADVSNRETTISASPTPTLRIYKDHPKSQIIGPVDTLIQTRHKSKEEQSKPDEKGIVIRNKARLVAQGHTPEEGIDYDEMDAKSVFLYGPIDEEVYVMQPFGFQNPEFPARVYKVEKAMYGLHQDPRAWYEFEALMHKVFQMSAMGELNFFLGLKVLQKKDGIFLSQDKYVGDILKKFGYSNVKSSNTLMDKENPWGKDGTRKDVDLHLYRSMIGSLMYLTASRPDIMFAVCACAWHQVTPKECHLHIVKRIFRYLKGHPKLGLRYPKESPFNLVAYSYSDYGGATQDRKSTTRGCQFLGRRLISWQCKKQTIVATSTTEKYEHNTDFHQIVDFVEASHLRIETTDKGIKIIAIVDGKLRTISESSIRRNLKLRYEARISSLPDAELFENLTLMGYNILPNQKFTFQKGQFSHQWKYLIHTIIPSFLGKTVPLFPSMLVTMGEGSGIPTEPHHTPSPEAQQTSPTATSSPSLPPVTTATIPTVIPIDTPLLRQYTRRARIAQSSVFPTAADEPASPIGDDSQGEACPTVSGLEAEQDRANIIKTSTLPSDSTSRVTSLAADEGSMQHKLNELTNLCTRLQRQQDEMASKITAQDLEIATLKARIKHLKDRDGGNAEPSGEYATIKGRRLETMEEAGIEKSTEKDSNDTEEMANILTSLDAASVLTSGVQVSVPPAAEVATVKSTPYTKRKGKKMVESDTPKKKKLQEQIDIQVAREMEEHMVREDQRRNEQIEKDAEIDRIHAEEELQMMIDGLDMNNETVAKCLQEYHQFAAETQQRKPLSKKQQKEFYMSVLRSHAGWKTMHFKGMTLEEIKEKFDPVWNQIKDYVPMGSKEEGRRFKRKGLRLEQDSAKKVKTSEEVSEEDLKTMMQLVPVEEVYVEALQALVRETLNIRQAASDKKKELWVELKILYEPDVEDQLWANTQTLMHDPVEWRLYDFCGVYHVLSVDQEIFMLVERDYPLRNGKALYSGNLIADGASSLGRIVENKMLKAFPLPVMSSHWQKKFALLVRKVPPVEEKRCHC